MRLDSDLRERVVACGLDLDEMEAIAASKRDWISDVLARIGSAEAQMFFAAQDAAQEKAAAADDGGNSPDDRGVGSRRWRREPGRSAVLSIRLDPDEYEHLRRRADLKNVGVSVLARSYIRKSLAAPIPSVLD